MLKAEGGTRAGGGICSEQLFDPRGGPGEDLSDILDFCVKIF